jgi:hypothetical protein
MYLACQLFQRKVEISDVQVLLRDRSVQPFLEWLGENIHAATGLLLVPLTQQQLLAAAEECQCPACRAMRAGSGSGSEYVQ